MKLNVEKPDRIFRIVAGLAVIGLGFAFQSWWGLIGVVLLITGLVRWCPLYAALGLKTLNEKHPQKA